MSNFEMVFEQKRFMIFEHGCVGEKDTCNSTLMVFVCEKCFFFKKTNAPKTTETYKKLSPQVLLQWEGMNALCVQIMQIRDYFVE